MGTLVPMFESATGNKVKISFKGGPAITTDVKQGAAALSSPAQKASTSLLRAAMWPATARPC
jgi:hypothetical protein